jgi:PAS domain S-box-containing protein
VITGTPPDPLDNRDRLTSRLLLAGKAVILGGFLLLLTRFAAFDALVRVAADLVSPDGVVTATGRSQLSRLILGMSGVVLVSGAFLLVLSNARWRGAVNSVLRWDALRQRGLQVPNPYWALAGSAGCGALIVALWIWRGHLGAMVEAAFGKEGFFEDVTFVLELAAGALCATAVVRWKVRDGMALRVARILYALCALGLFFVGMEEINWGQTLLGFETPASWAAINYQHQTSVHNLLDRGMLTEGTKLLAFAFGFVVLGMIGWSVRASRSFIGAIAPSVSLVPLAVIISAGGMWLHPEILELLLSVFFAFYSYRVLVAVGRNAEVPPGAADVPLARAGASGERRDRSWNNELLEYTHDAIIIWELDGAGILYWNGAAEKLYGYDRAEAHGRITHELLKTRLAGGVGHLEHTLARFGIWVGELQHITRDGRTVIVNARLALMAQDNGRWLVLEVNRDVTDLKIAEEERQAVERQLAELRSRQDVRARSEDTR